MNNTPPADRPSLEDLLDGNWSPDANDPEPPAFGDR